MVAGCPESGPAMSSQTGGMAGSGGVVATGGATDVYKGGVGGVLGSGGSPATGGSSSTAATGGIVAVGGGGSGGTALLSNGGAGGNGGRSSGGSGGLGSAGVGGTGPGGSAGASSAGSGGSSGASLAALAEAFCAAARTCCSKAGLASSLADCETRFQARLPGMAFVAKGTEVIDNAALASCIAGYKETVTTCAFNPLETACAGVFIGTKAEGAACGAGGIPMTGGAGECKAGGRGEMCLWTGDANASTTTGTCRALVHGKAGDPCATSCPNNDDCVFDLLTSPGYPTAACFESDGLYCVAAGASSVCKPIVAPGGSCEDDQMACASDTYCDTSVMPAVCKVSGTLGQACSTGGVRCGRSLECGTDNRCDDLGFAYETTCSGTPPFPL